MLYILVTVGKSERSGVPKHTEESRVICLHHLAVDTFPFTSMAYKQSLLDLAPDNLLPAE